MPAVAIATCAEHAQLDDEGRLLLAALRSLGVAAAPVVWDAADVEWERFDLVVVRSTWDYTFALARFLAWTRSVGERLLNAPPLIAWSADKRYLLSLAEVGLPVIDTVLLQPGAPFEPPPAGRFVVKPAVSAGSRGAAVFDAARHDAARAHVAALQTDGRDVIVQPYLAAVDGEEAETALVFLDGALSHAMRKGPLLALDRPPVNAGWAPETMSRVTPAADVVALGERAHALVQERFGRPLYARVDVLRDNSGAPAILELELIEPSLFLDHVPGTAETLAGAILDRLAGLAR